MTVDHYEQLFDSKYMRWFHLNGTPALVEITKVEKDIEMTLPGGAKSKRPLVTIKLVQGKADVKPLVLNKTNANSIAAIHGVRPAEWVGKQVVLYQDQTEMYDKTQRKMVTKECVRIRAKKGTE